MHHILLRHIEKQSLKVIFRKAIFKKTNSRINEKVQKTKKPL